MQPTYATINLEWKQQRDGTRVFTTAEVGLEAEAARPVMIGRTGASPIKVTSLEWEQQRDDTRVFTTAEVGLEVEMNTYAPTVEINATVRGDPVLQTLLQQIATRIATLCAAYPETPGDVS